MSAKKPKAAGSKPIPARAAAPASTPTPLPSTSAAAATAESAAPAWFDSADPRKRLIARIAFAGIWVYIAALWLLALDQTFDWGIFGPKLPAM